MHWTKILKIGVCALMAWGGQAAAQPAPARLWNARFPLPDSPPGAFADSCVGIMAAKGLEPDPRKFLYAAGNLRISALTNPICVVRYPFDGPLPPANHEPDKLAIWGGGLVSPRAMVVYPPTSLPLVTPNLFSVYVTAAEPQANGGAGTDWVTVGFDWELNVKWTARMQSADTAAPVAIVVTSTLGADETVIVAGIADFGASESDYYVVGYRASDGKALWKGRWQKAGVDTVAGMALGNNRVWVTGTAAMLDGGVLRNKIATMSYRVSDGVQDVFLEPPGLTDGRSYEAAAVAFGADPAVPTTSILAVTGSVRENEVDVPPRSNIFTVAYDPLTLLPPPTTNHWAWTDEWPHNGYDDKAADVAAAVAATPEGGFAKVWITGKSDQSLDDRSIDILSIQYNHFATPESRRDWVARWDRGVGGQDLGTSISFEPHRSGLGEVEVHVGGITRTSPTGGNWDYVVTKYNLLPAAQYQKNQAWPLPPTAHQFYPSVGSPNLGDDLLTKVKSQHLDGNRYFFMAGTSFGGSTSGDDWVTTSNLDPVP